MGVIVTVGVLDGRDVMVGVRVRFGVVVVGSVGVDVRVASWVMIRGVLDAGMLAGWLNVPG